VFLFSSFEAEGRDNTWTGDTQAAELVRKLCHVHYLCSEQRYLPAFVEHYKRENEVGMGVFVRCATLIARKTI
jgi:hypothetical protein